MPVEVEPKQHCDAPREPRQQQRRRDIEQRVEDWNRIGQDPYYHPEQRDGEDPHGPVSALAGFGDGDGGPPAARRVRCDRGAATGAGVLGALE